MMTKFQLAKLLIRVPLLSKAITHSYRLTRGRYTAGVVGVLLDAPREHVFLVEHVFHPRRPWGLPGGWLDRNEHPSQAIEREFMEETALDVHAVRPLMVETGQYRGSHLDIAYLVSCQQADVPPQLSEELTAYQWCALDTLPPMSLFSRRVLDLVQQQLREGEL